MLSTRIRRPFALIFNGRAGASDTDINDTYPDNKSLPTILTSKAAPFSPSTLWILACCVTVFLPYIRHISVIVLVIGLWSILNVSRVLFIAISSSVLVINVIVEHIGHHWGNLDIRRKTIACASFPVQRTVRLYENLPRRL